MAEVIVSDSLRLAGVVMEGNVVVGGQTLSGSNADELGLVALNRDVGNAQEITRDQDIGGLNASVTVDGRWFTEEGREEMLQQQKDIGPNMQRVLAGVGGEINLGIRIGVNVAGVENPAAMIEKIDSLVGTFGIVPTSLNNGGLLAQLPGQFLPGSDVAQKQMVGATADSDYVLSHPELGWVPITETPGYYLMNPAQQALMANVVVSTNPVAIEAGTATYQNSTNGMLNTPALAMYNAVTQTHNLVADPNQTVLVMLNYNPTRGVIADGLESAQDKVAIGLGQSWMATNVAVDTGIFVNQVMLARGKDRANFANHSQGNLLNFSGLLATGLDKNIEFGPNNNRNYTWNMFGSPVNAKLFAGYLEDNSMLLTSSSVNNGDFVGQRLGGNKGLYVYGQDGSLFNTVHHFSKGLDRFVFNTVESVKLDETDNARWGKFASLFKRSSPHSNYTCVIKCGAEPVRNSQ